MPSKETFRDLCLSLHKCKSVLELLYPGDDISALSQLSRIQLLERLDLQPLHERKDRASESVSSTPHMNMQPTIPCESCQPALDSHTSLGDLELIPCEDYKWDENTRGSEDMPVVADDVNALSLSFSRRTSFLGASSVKVSFLVMARIRPDLQILLANKWGHRMPARRPQTVALSSANSVTNRPIPWSRKGQILVDAYFKRVHVLVPMLQEASFRAAYLNGKRLDRGWLALLNAVLAMGSIAATQADNVDHLHFYKAAIESISIDRLADGSIETLQAVIILGGYYLHYVNRPNLADTFLGAAFRMASALGFHREASVSNTPSNGNESHTVDMRRRTWWSLFCLDTWASTTTGRPSFGRCSPMVNVGYPESGASCTGPTSEDASEEFSQYSGVLPLVANAEFCKIATTIQDALASAPLLCKAQRWKLDTQLVEWYQSLPTILRRATTSNESLRMACCVIKWRYQNLRMLLHRPVLLSYGIQNADSSDRSDPGADVDEAAIGICRDIAEATIQHVANERVRDQISGWNAAWFLYQAALVPLLSLLMAPYETRAGSWCHSIETAIESLGIMKSWSPSAEQSREALVKIYEFSTGLRLPDNCTSTMRPGQGSDECSDVTTVPNEQSCPGLADLELNCTEGADPLVEQVICQLTSHGFNAQQDSIFPHLPVDGEGNFFQYENLFTTNNRITANSFQT